MSDDYLFYYLKQYTNDFIFVVNYYTYSFVNGIETPVYLKLA